MLSSHSLLLPKSSEALVFMESQKKVKFLYGVTILWGHDILWVWENKVEDENRYAEYGDIRAWGYLGWCRGWGGGESLVKPLSVFFLHSWWASMPSFRRLSLNHPKLSWWWSRTSTLVIKRSLKYKQEVSVVVVIYCTGILQRNTIDVLLVHHLSKPPWSHNMWWVKSSHLWPFSPPSSCLQLPPELH